MLYSFSIETRAREELRNIGPQVQELVARSQISRGMCYIFVPHTTAGVTINENADPDVSRDILEHLEKLVPHSGSYRHREGNAPAHVKASLVGCCQTVPLENGRLGLGTWQGIFLCEFDGPRRRTVTVRLVPDPS